MSKRFKPDKRVIFPVRQQHRFLLRVKEQLDFSSWIIFAKKIGAHPRTLNDWKREEYSIPLGVVKKVSRIAKVKIPKNVEIKEPFWYVYKGAKIGGKLGALACFKKYGSYGGNPEYRKKKWYEWWEKEGRYRKHPLTGITRPIKKPRLSKRVAEFVGIVLGDGCITQGQITITLHREDDKEYSKFVVNLIKKLFNVPIGTHYDKECPVVDFIISRTELVNFCTKRLGLKKGNKIKQQVDIPEWIKNNKRYAITCVRGLVDTDGCIFTHSYKVNGKIYKYKKFVFTSYSGPLRQSVFKILKNNGLSPRLAANRDVRLDSIADMKRYFKIFNSHNPKHLKKYKNWNV